MKATGLWQVLRQWRQSWARSPGNGKSGKELQRIRRRGREAMLRLPFQEEGLSTVDLWMPRIGKLHRVTHDGGLDHVVTMQRLRQSVEIPFGNLGLPLGRIQNTT